MPQMGCLELELMVPAVWPRSPLGHPLLALPASLDRAASFPYPYLPLLKLSCLFLNSGPSSLLSQLLGTSFPLSFPKIKSMQYSGGLLDINNYDLEFNEMQIPLPGVGYKLLSDSPLQG